TVTQAAPGLLTTTPVPGMPMPLGTKINDSGTLSGTYATPSGTATITFYLLAPGDLGTNYLTTYVYKDVVTISAPFDGTYNTTTMGNNSGGYTTIVVGTYHWVAVFSGDVNNPQLGPKTPVGDDTMHGDEPQVIFQPFIPTDVVTNSSLCQFNTDPSA